MKLILIGGILIVVCISYRWLYGWKSSLDIAIERAVSEWRHDE